MPHFYNERKKLIISTSYKVMYTRLVYERSLQAVDLPFLAHALKGADWYVLVRNPYDRLLSFFKDKFRQNLDLRRRRETPWQDCQRLFFNRLDIDNSMDDEAIEKRFSQTAYGEFIHWLPACYKDNVHLHPQSVVLQEIDAVLSSVAAQGIDCCYQLVHIDRGSEMLAFARRSGMNMGRIVNSTQRIWLEDSHINTAALQVIHQVYTDDFKQLDYQMRSPQSWLQAEQRTGSSDGSPMIAKNFIDQAKLLMGVILDIKSGPLPEHLDSAEIYAHARKFSWRIQRYREEFKPPLRDFFHAYLEQDRPAEVVYPFGGGDLISALLAFDGPMLLTTISLELAGDPRCIDRMNEAQVQQALSDLHEQMRGMLRVGSTSSENLSHSQSSDLPVQLLSSLAALEAHDYEPIAVYYFALTEDGTIDYFDEARLKALDNRLAQRLLHTWSQPNFSCAFANVEIHYRSKNQGPTRIFRHIAANLFNEQFVENSPLRRHLEAKGQVSGLVKGASYLLWRNSCELFRDYMLEFMPFIVSDSTGIPLKHAKAKGFAVQPFGRFNGSLLKANQLHNDEMRALWNSAPYVEMPARFGYVDNVGEPHLMFASKDVNNSC